MHHDCNEARSRRSSTFTMRTMGHATLVLLQDDVPLIATDPWLIGSTYFRSWWLDEYPTDEDLDLAAAAGLVYVTHSHPDHFHPPTLRHLGRPVVLNPDFPGYRVPRYLAEHGFESRIMEPGRWYRLSDEVRVVSVPVLADDSVLILDTPVATIVNLNDCAPPPSLLHMFRKLYLAPDKPVVALASHSPASSGSSMYRNGRRSPLHGPADYARLAGRSAEALGASHLVSFASQTSFGRSDSKWANAFKVTNEGLAEHWAHPQIEICPPHITMDLETLDYVSCYVRPDFELSAGHRAAVKLREEDEAVFELPATFPADLGRYLAEIRGLRLLFRRGIGWRLSTSGRELFYDVRRRRVSEGIPDHADAVITCPDMLLADVVSMGNLTDLGITMAIRTDSRVDIRRPYLFFSLAGLRDYGHLRSARAMWRFAWFNARFLEPRAFPRWWRTRSGAATLPIDSTATVAPTVD